ncbi:MAG: hypothetical protein FJ087_11730 [Deltaproteobacteria bacterium]|nr:hypothetical protein [Deltaproteobacteria bacterium]
MSDEGNVPYFRYLRALPAEDLCLSCHAAQHAGPGELRGGMSVSLPCEPFLESENADALRLVLEHLVSLSLALGIAIALGGRLVGRIRALRRLEGFLSICAWCKRVRVPSPAGTGRAPSWVAIEEYVSDKTDARFSHGMCQDCARKMGEDAPDRR